VGEQKGKRGKIGNGLNQLAHTLDQRWTGIQEKRHIGAEGKREIGKRLWRQSPRKETRKAAQHCTGVARAPAQTAAGRDPFDEPHPDPTGESGGMQKGFGRPVSQITGPCWDLIGAALRERPCQDDFDVHPTPIRRLDHQLNIVVKIDGREEAFEKVIPIFATPHDAKAKIDLGGRAKTRFDHGPLRRI